MDLRPELKIAATKALRDNALLTQMTLQEREEAAQWYDQIASQMVGTQAKLARRYNLVRAKFLRGEITHIALSAVLFGAKME